MITECMITAFECKWTGKNVKEIEKFFKKVEYTKFQLLEDNGLLLYDEFCLIEKGTTIIANKHFGIFAKLEIFNEF